MAVYQLYKLIFDRSSQRDLYALADGCSAFQKAQDLLDGMLKGVKTQIVLKSIIPTKEYGKAKYNDC